MSFKFNLFPTEPQKSYYPVGQLDSTANSLYQQPMSNRAVTNQYELKKSSGNAYWANSVGAPGGYIQTGQKQISNPNLFKRIGSSKTYNDGTGSRLQRLKAAAITHSTKPT
jgi:hypothetical protein